MHLAAAPIPPHVLVIGRRPRPNSALPVSLGTDISHAADVLRAGGLVAFPTETVYGLGADATSAAAVARVFAVKGRPRAHPLIVHLAGADDLGAWTERPGADALALARAFWPGPLTLIVRRGPGVLDAVSGGAPTVGLRVPAHPMARALLAAFGGGVAAPSANRFGAVSPTTAAHVVADLGDDVDYVLDGGPCQVGVESTIVDLAGDAPALLRPGGIARAAVAAVLGRPLAAGSATPPGTCPRTARRGQIGGSRARGPRRRRRDRGERRRRRRPDRGAGAGAALAAAALPAAVTIRALPDDDAAMAHDLYAALRELDRGDVTTIVAALPAEAGLGAAVADRLRRAAGPRTVEDDLG
ncbi:MAG: threonylcarbamoyl-AMP synthase [Kofleriaceae bacterium]|nr:threonylcarbamoyl-AMP synthase [Kofleriaceae bacterium]